MERLSVSSSGHFLVTESGAPFFWLGDTAWELFHRLTLENAAYYLERRRQQGFTVIQAVVLAEMDGLRVPNMNGDLPLTDLDPTRPNEAYFRHVDAVIDRAEQLGLYVGLLPTWGDKVNLRWGSGPVVFNEDNARFYGAWLGRRYRDRPNLIWILGGDRDEVTHGVDYAPVWRAMAAGIRSETGERALMSYHPLARRGSSAAFHHDGWLNVNMWQSGHMEPDLPVWDMIASDYARVPTKPVLDGEPNYEDHPINPFTRPWDPSMGYFRDLDVRKQAYRTVFAGACGHTYGHHAVWQFFDETQIPINYPDRPWRSALERPGAAQMQHLKSLILAHTPLLRLPDQDLVLDAPLERARHVQAARASDGRWALVYTPPGNPVVTVNIARLSAGAPDASWFDPETGAYVAASSVQVVGQPQAMQYAVPSAEKDWVLRLAL